MSRVNRPLPDTVHSTSPPLLNFVNSETFEGLGVHGSESDSICGSKIQSSDPSTSVYMASEKVHMNLDGVETLIKTRYWNIWHCSLKNIYKNPSIT